MSLQTISSICALYPSLVMTKMNMGDKEPSDIEKVIAEFMAKMKPVTPEMLTAARSAKKKKTDKKAEEAKQKRYKRIEKLKGSKILDGVAVSPGIVAGIVRNVRQHLPELMTRIQAGEVVVGERFTAEHYSYFKIAAAFVTDSGGANSSTAIMARGFGVPAVTGTVEATLVLKDGQKVVVDGSEGAIYAYKEKAAPKHSEHRGNQSHQ